MVYADGSISYYIWKLVHLAIGSFVFAWVLWKTEVWVKGKKGKKRKK